MVGHVVGEEAEEVVVHAEQVLAMLERVVEPFARDLRELAAAVEPGGSKGVGGRGEDAPVCGGRGVACRMEGLAIVE